MEWITDRPELLELALGLAVALAASAFAWARGRRWWRSLKDSEAERALVAVAAAVEEVGREYVDHLKAAKRDGKLRPQEKAEAHRRARVALKRIAREDGVDALAALGRNQVEYWIKRAAEWRKDPGGSTDPAFGRLSAARRGRVDRVNGGG